MKCFILLYTTVFIFTSASFAQHNLKGKVYDASTHNPLSGATISASGKAITTTGRDGGFSFNCSDATEITVSYIGYTTVQQVINNCDEPLSIGLIPSGGLLNEVEITATSNQNKSLLFQPASIAKLNNTELKRGTGLFLDDAINGNVPGVTMQRRTVSAGQQFNIRGYGNGMGFRGISSNFDVQGTKVYLNGIPITDAEGITLTDDIDFGSVGDVEVTKGPSGTLYGLAIAGVVNLNTVKPEKGKTSIGQDIMLGSFGLKRFTTHFETGGERSSLLLNYGYQESDGFMKHNASSKRFVNMAGDFRVNDQESVTGYFGFSNSYDERGGELTIARYNNFDYSGNPEYIKRDAHSAITSFRGGIGHTYRFSSRVANTTTVFATGVSNNSSSAGGWTDKNPINYGLRSTMDMKFSLKEGITLSGITGVETQRQYAQTIGYGMVANPNDSMAYWIVGAMRSNQATITGTLSLFTEWTLSLPHDFSVTAGAGLSSTKIKLNDRFYVASNRNPTEFAKNYNGMVSPHIAINKVFSKQLSVYASWNRGYRAPVSSYFFIPSTGQLNTGLKPETGDQFEIGTKGVLLHNKLSYTLALFDAVFSNKMTAIAVPLNGSTTTTAYTYIANGGKQDDKGMEALVKYTAYSSAEGFFTAVRPFANLAWSRFRYKNYRFQSLNGARTGVVETDYSGKAVAGVAPLTTSLGVDVQAAPGIYANIIYSYKDGMPISSDGLNNTTSYNLLNAKLGIQRSLSAHFDVDAFFGVNNITGTQYPLMVFVNQLPDAYLPAPDKANYFGGINIKYNF
jgi:iron complex outermembrane receptor protein